jgi:Ser/Thr protein kinase RdoA (MazF antagonist)
MYDIGELRGAQELHRGAGRSPKVILDTSTGRRLLKRRPPGRTALDRLQCAQRVHEALREAAFPVARLIAPRDRREGYVQHNNHTYELFEYIETEPYNGTLSATLEVGQVLGDFHRVLATLRDALPAPHGGYHDLAAVRTGLNAIPSSIDAHASVFGREAELLSLIQRLYDRYDEACARVEGEGFAQLLPHVLHGDFHPGNVLFHNGHVAAVIDFDSVRIGPRVLDLANGLLHFSILGGGHDPDAWPAYFDASRIKRMVLGYRGRTPIAGHEVRMLLPLMSEALISEAVGPIAATGSFGRLPGFGFLKMIERKVAWLEANAGQLMSALGS